jgi:hypothetical protein
MSEQWPPHWGDPDGEDLDAELPEKEQPDTGHLDQDVLAEQLAQVSSALASVPMPTLPDAFATRIGAAIAAEAATRGENTGAVGVSATVRSVSPESSTTAADGGTTTAPPARSLAAGARRAARPRGASRASGPAGSRPPGQWRKRLVSPAVMAPLLICLVLGGFGYLFTRIGGTSSSSSISSAAGTAASPLNGNAAGSALPYSESVPAREPAKGASTFGGQLPNFTIKQTGTRYAAATLATQVRDALATAHGTSSPSAGPSASASAAGSASAASSAISGGSAASKALAGCVYRLTGDVRPSLVDRATYAGRPAYIIAVPSQVWVVGLGCTAANTELITTTALTGLSGNLRALGSV